MATLTVPAEILKRSSSDVMPRHWGAQLTVALVGSQLRRAEYGDRTSYVDMLSELIKADGHANGVLRKLFTAVANKSWSLNPAETTDPRESDQATIIAEQARKMVATIPRWRRHVAGMLWGWFYGVSGREVSWKLTSEGLRVAQLKLIHSRRIVYDTTTNPWRACVTDGSSAYSTGTYADKWPGRIFLFEPSLDDDYQPRQGIGQVMAYWMAFKRFGARDFLSFVERYGKPTPVVTYKAGRDAASKEDIEVAEDVVKKIGQGTQPGAVLPDTCTLGSSGPGSSSTGSGGSGETTPHRALIDLCNAENSKAVTTGTLTADVGRNGGGAYSLGQRQGDDQDEVISALASQFDDSVTEGLILPWVIASFGEKYAHLCPSYHTKVEQDSDTKALGELFDVAKNKLGMKVPTRFAHAALSIPEPSGDEPILGDGRDSGDEPTEEADEIEDESSDDGEQDSKEEQSQ